MFVRSLEARSYPRVPEPRENGQRILTVELAGRAIDLPLIDGTPVINGVPHIEEWIAYFDPRVERVKEAGALELAQRVLALDIDVMVTPSSDKSLPMMRRVQRIVADYGKYVNLVILTRGKPGSPEMRDCIQNAADKIIYRPITSGNEDRIMVASPEDEQRLGKYLQNYDRLGILDDVYSTGKTIQAVKYLIDCVCRWAGMGEESPNLPMLAVMRECKMNAQGELDMPDIPDLYTAIATPVISGPLI